TWMSAVMPRGSRASGRGAGQPLEQRLGHGARGAGAPDLPHALGEIVEKTRLGQAPRDHDAQLLGRSGAERGGGGDDEALVAPLVARERPEADDGKIAGDGFGQGYASRLG